MASESKRAPRSRMTGKERREQLLDVSRRLFAEKGFEGTSIEEIASRAEVSKPVVYEHFGGKEGIYAVVVDREIQALTGALTGALASSEHPKVLLERTALALLEYIETSTDGFRILVRDSPVAQATGTFSSLIGDVATQVEHLLAEQFTRRGHGAGPCAGRPAGSGPWCTRGLSSSGRGRCRSSRPGPSRPARGSSWCRTRSRRCAAWPGSSPCGSRQSRRCRRSRDRK